MTVLTALVDRHGRLLSQITVGWTASGVLLYVWAPLSSPAVLLLAAVAPVAWSLSREKLAISKPSAMTMTLVVTAGYLTVNASWSLSPSAAHVALYMVFVSLVAVRFIMRGLQGCEADALRAMAVGLYAGMLIRGTVIFIDAFSEQGVHRLLLNLAPSLRPHLRHMIVQDGRVIHLESHVLNLNITALALLFWPTTLGIALLAQTPRLKRWMLVGVAPTVAAIFGSHHGTSKIAFVGAAITFAGFRLWPAGTRRSITAAWTAIVLLVGPLATLAYQSQLYLSPWLPRSAQHRIVLWGHTSQQIGMAPLLGVGIESTRALDESRGDDAPLAPGSDFRQAPGFHSHNVYVQIWCETDAVGAVLLLAIGLLVLWSMARAPIVAQPYLYASFAASTLMAASSFGLWQSWFMASFGLVAAFSMMGRVLTEGNTPSSTPLELSERS